MKYLVIDIGNSLAKFAMFEHSVLMETNVATYSDTTINDIIISFLSNCKVNYCIVSSVTNLSSGSLDGIQQFVEHKIMYLNHLTKIPLTNLYKTPETLGFDRIAAAVGANYLYPNENLLVIDAGTAITYEFVNSKAHYLGGNIAPGLQMRLKSLNYFTQKLPLVQAQFNPDWIGSSTESAIVNGVIYGLKFEIESYYQMCLNTFENIRIILTGGDAIFLRSIVKNPIFAVQNLVLIGLKRILDYNVSEKNFPL